MADINGTNGNDNINGTEQDDTITAGSGNDVVSGGAGGDVIYGDSGDSLSAGGDGVPGDTLGDGPGSTGGGYDRIDGQTVYNGNHTFSTDAFYLGNDIPVLDDANRNVITGVSFSQDGEGTDRTFGLDELTFTGAQRSYVGLVTVQDSDVHGANDQFSSSISGGFQDTTVVSSGTADFTMNDGQVFQGIRVNFVRGPDGETFMMPDDGPSPYAFNAFRNMLATNDSGIKSFEIATGSGDDAGINPIEGNWADGQFAEITNPPVGDSFDDVLCGDEGDDIIYGDGGDSATAAGFGVAGGLLGDGPGSTGGGYDRVYAQSVYNGNHSFSTDAFYLGNDIPVLDDANRNAITGVSFSQDGEGTDRTFGLDELTFTGAQRSYVGLVTVQDSDVHGANDQFSSSISGGFQDTTVVSSGTADFTMNDGQVFQGIRVNFVRGPDGETFMMPDDGPSPYAFNAFRNMLATNDSGIKSFEIATGSGDDAGINPIEGNWADGQFKVTQDGEGGDDIIKGGAGSDTMFGEGGDDTFLVESAADGAGDVVVGGNGPDQNTDTDVLDLTGAGRVDINDAVDANDAGATAGTVTFEDGSTLTFEGIEQIITDPDNRAPNAVDDTLETNEDEPVTINVLANDTDPENDPLTVVDATVPADQGTVAIIGNQVVFTPAEDFTGEATITYTVEDPDGLQDTAEVAVDVLPVNDAPDAVDDSNTTPEDTPITVDLLANDTDVDGDDLTVVAATVPAAQGTLVDNGDGTVTFTPAPDFTGEATITYTVEDPDGLQDTAVHTIDVTPENDAPNAVDDTLETNEDEPVTIDVLANDTDPENDPLTVVDATVPADQGTVEIVDGELVFTPAPDFNGPATITYTVEDPDGLQDTAEVAVDVLPVNDAPDAVDDDYNLGTTPVAGVIGNVIDNDSDPENDPLSVSSVNGVAGNVGTAVAGNNGGLVTINADGTVSFDPNGDFDDLGLGESATTSVTYHIDDGNGGTDEATVTITVDGINNGTVEGTSGSDVIAPGYVDGDGDIVDGNDAILPGDTGDDDLIYGFDGDDTIEAGDGNDEVFGGTGADVIGAGEGNDTVNGDEGMDMIFGGKGDDLLDGGDDDDKIEGGSGDDTLIGGEGNDDLWGASGDDSVDGGAGNDVIATAEGNDVVEGGTGDDTIDTGNDENPFTTDPGQNLPDVGYPGLYPADLDPNDDLDTVFGGAGNDVISTGDDDDVIFGGSGNDLIDAGIDDDYVEAGTGNDTIIGSEGNDEIYGEDGDDVIYGGLEPGVADQLNIPDDLNGDGDNNDPGEDLVTFNNNDTLFGGAGEDTIFGADDDDQLFGGADNDVLDGGIDDDELYGGDGDDELIGGQGNDTIEGGFGSDTILGGNGGDVVVGGEDPDDGDVDVLDLTGSNVDFITYVDGDPEAGTVTFLDGSTMTFSEIENVIPCFTPGTTIATSKGERLVEELQPGDRIITRDNGFQEIAWVGAKHMTGLELAKRPNLKPVFVKAGSLGHGLPERDMMLSPNHKVFLASDEAELYFEEREVLVAAKHLIGKSGIHQVDVPQTTYIHFMFERHEVVLSNGAWTESFHPGDYSIQGIDEDARNEILALFPELATEKGLKDYRLARTELKKHEARLLIS